MENEKKFLRKKLKHFSMSWNLINLIKIWNNCSKLWVTVTNAFKNQNEIIVYNF